jgi:4'-phosphopantetheinyl transferase
VKYPQYIEPGWEMPRSKIVIGDEEIHVWRANLDLPDIVLNKFYKVLTYDERVRAQRFNFEKDMRRYVARHGILRTILGHYLCITPCCLRFSYGEKGKPTLINKCKNGTIVFSMSDSADVALYAFAMNIEIGVDIEYISSIPNMNKIAENIFSCQEYQLYYSLSDLEKRDMFFNCWTRKEALVKALGYGLSWPLNSLDVSLVTGEPVRLLEVEGGSSGVSQWCIQDLKPSHNYTGAVAINRLAFEIKLLQLDIG